MAAHVIMDASEVYEAPDENISYSKKASKMLLLRHGGGVSGALPGQCCLSGQLWGDPGKSEQYLVNKGPELYPLRKREL